MTKERQKKRKRLRGGAKAATRAPAFAKASADTPELVFTPKFHGIAALHRERMQQLFGAKEQWSREECSIALDQLIAEGVIALDL
jgi:hypothetical protein